MMTCHDAKAILEELLAQGAAVCDIAKVAGRHGKSLGGNNPYGERFHGAAVAMSRTETQLGSVMAATGLAGDESEKLSGLLDILRSPNVAPRQRNDALKAMRMVCQATIVPALERLTANPVPDTEQVLPLDVVRPARRTYIERVVLQANGCYERRWYDACAVMVRRLVETVIIELYEAKGKGEEIKNGAGDFLMLSGLVDAVLAEKSWNLGREVKRALPEIKALGDRAAHARRWIATKQDIDKVISGLRAVVEELLHLAGLV